MKDQPKTQSKIEEEIREILLPLYWDAGGHGKGEKKLDGYLPQIVSIFKVQQSALLQRVIELIGKDEELPKDDHLELVIIRNLNQLRKQLKTKISQMGEEKWAK